MPDVGESGTAAGAAGSGQAAESPVRAHVPGMLVTARRILRDGGLAEDCVQGAFIDAFRNIEGFEGRSSLKSWLHRIVVNQALTRLRTRARQNEGSIDALLPTFDDNACRIEQPWQPLATRAEILERNAAAPWSRRRSTSYRSATGSCYSFGTLKR